MPLGAILHHVTDEFTAHARLAGLQLASSITPEASTRMLPEDPTAAAVTGALFATLSYLEEISNPKIELNAEALPGRGLTIDVIQRSVRLASRPWTDIGDREVRHPEALIPALALRLAMSVAAARGGSAELTPLTGQGSMLRLTYPS